MTEIALVGECWGESEERERTAFCGPTGYELTRMLEEAGIKRADCFLTNVFNLRPPASKTENLCGDREWAIKDYPPLLKGKFVRAEYQPELDRLASELAEINPNIIVALGNTATWALLGKTAISKTRGTTQLSTHTITGFKVLPTYHPAAIFRQYELRPVAIADLMKAQRESATGTIARPARTIWIEPTIEDIHEFRKRYIDKASILSVDIETIGTQITCIGFAPTKHMSLVIPFLDPRRMGRNYWPTAKIEREAWEIVKDILSRAQPAKVFQNGLYDIAFLWRAYGIKVKGADEDTMLLHHALQPESLKGLAFLGSVYTDEGAWKSQMRVAKTTIKRDD